MQGCATYIQALINFQEPKQPQEAASLCGGTGQAAPSGPAMLYRSLAAARGGPGRDTIFCSKLFAPPAFSLVGETVAPSDTPAQTVVGRTWLTSGSPAGEVTEWDGECMDYVMVGSWSYRTPSLFGAWPCIRRCDHLLFDPLVQRQVQIGLVAGDLSPWEMPCQADPWQRLQGRPAGQTYRTLYVRGRAPL